MIKKIYFITDHKTGSVWMGKILKNFSKDSNYILVEKSHGGIKGLRKSFIKFLKYRKGKLRRIWDLMTKNKIYILYRADINIRNNSPKIILIRDPRDICISAANYDGKNNNDDPKDRDFIKYQATVADMSFDEIVLFQANGESRKTAKRLQDFISKHDPYVVKYEDLFTDIDNNFAVVGKICDYLGFNFIEKNNFRIAYKASHIKKSGTNSHVSNGGVEQYKKLNEKTLDKLNSTLEAYIQNLGYGI